MSLKQRLGFEAEPLYHMDGTAFLYRGFFANANMSRSDGLPTGALYIVGRVLLRLFREEQPEYFAFILDGPGRHFRHELLPTYKANRPAAPEGLVAQIEPMKRMVASFGLRCIVSEGCEADDCVASLAARGRDERPVVIIGMDKDLRQCLAPDVVLWDPASREEKLITLESFREQTGLEPSQWPDVQALIGDSSDNVPGVRGIGEKTAGVSARSHGRGAARRAQKTGGQRGGHVPVPGTDAAEHVVLCRRVHGGSQGAPPAGGTPRADGPEFSARV